MSHYDVWTAGETLGLLTTRDSGPLESGVSLSLGFGGAESNLAIGLARLVLAALWTSALGDDSLGDMVYRELGAQGVHLAVRRDASRGTGMMLKIPNVEGIRKVSYFRKESAASALSVNDVCAQAISLSRLVHLTGITPALSVSARGFITEVIDKARELRVPVCFDLNYREALWCPQEASDFYLQVLPKLDIVSGSPDEFALFISGANGLKDIAQKVSSLGPQEVIVKNGAQGAGVLDHGTWVESPALPTDVVDAVGAGDAFLAGYLAERFRGGDVARRLQIALFAGAQCCAHYGDWEGNPILQELPEFCGRVPK